MTPEPMTAAPAGSPRRRFWIGALLLSAVVLLVVVVGGNVCPLRPGERPRGDNGAPSNAARVLAPALAVNDLEGRPWSLAAQHGQVVLVNLFATWCPPCRAEMPELVAIAGDYQPKGVAFLGLSLDEGGPGVVRPFVQRQGMPFPVALAQPGMEFTAGVTGIPVTIIIDRAGRVARTYVGMISAKEVRRDLDSLLAEAAPSRHEG